VFGQPLEGLSKARKRLQEICKIPTFEIQIGILSLDGFATSWPDPNKRII
jgi:hypothetical protein